MHFYVFFILYDLFHCLLKIKMLQYALLEENIGHLLWSLNVFFLRTGQIREAWVPTTGRGWAFFFLDCAGRAVLLCNLKLEYGVCEAETEKHNIPT